MKEKKISKEHVFLIILSLFLGLISSFSSGSAEETYIYVNATDVNIRETPGLDGKIIEIIQKGEKLKVLKEKEDWYYVEYGEGKKGWIFNELVRSPMQSVTNTPTPEIIITPTPSEKPHNKIVFAAEEGLRIIYANGTGLSNLTDEEGDNFPVWSPDGKKIAFINYREGRNLYIINSDGTGRKKISNTGSVLPGLAWSSDGQSLLFSAESPDELYYSNIFISDLETGVNISQNKLYTDKKPLWSPDEKYIAFESRRNKNSDIYIMTEERDNDFNLTDFPSEDLLYSWTSKGIIFTSDRDGMYEELNFNNPAREIYLINPESRSLTNLTNSLSDDYNPILSPDEKYMAFISSEIHEKQISEGEIFIMDLSSGKTVQISDLAGTKSNISWSPDNSRFVFQVNNYGKNDLYIVNHYGTNLFYLTSGHSPDWFPIIISK